MGAPWGPHEVPRAPQKLPVQGGPHEVEIKILLPPAGFLEGTPQKLPVQGGPHEVEVKILLPPSGFLVVLAPWVHMGLPWGPHGILMGARWGPIGTPFDMAKVL